MTNGEIRELANSNELNIAVVGKRVYEVSRYAKGLRVFPTKKWLLLNHYSQEIPLEECAKKAGMTIEEADEFINTPKAQEWLERQAVIQAKRQKWADGGEWVAMGDECLEGKKHLSKDQQVVFQAFGDRFMPKPRQDSQDTKTTINFNFTVDDVKEALRREESIEARLANEG